MPAPTVLVVDDDDAIHEFVSAVLEHEGLGVLHARTGVEGLKHLDHHQPALVLLDLMMPVMNGWQFLEELLRRSGVLPPVVVGSAYIEDSRDVPAGAVAVLKKPYVLQDLLATVRRYARAHAPAPQ
jgi:CheY-like chemotaxis protein